MNVGPGFKNLVSEFKDVFVDELPDGVPLRREIEFDIKLKKDQPLPVRPVISLSKDELK